jgi:dTDP-4-amino-4,6-dideoxygalactose transaminase
MSDFIYLSSPDVGEAEEQAIIEALHSGWIAPLGPMVDAFEAEMAERIGVAHAVALSSGTAALHLALLGAGVGRGDIVVTSTLTFAATANAITYTGAEPYFIDVLPETGNMAPEALERALARLTAAGEPVKVVMPVDLLGKAADYTAIEPIVQRYGLTMICDAAEALGATHAGRPAGSFGEAAVLSFNGNKIITTSGGGMLLTNDSALADRARYLATQARQPVVWYEHTDIGYNYRMSNLLAAMGRAQLGRLDGMIARRRELRNMYKQFWAEVPGVSVFGAQGDEADNAWLTSILVDPEVAGWTAEDLRVFLLSQGIESRPIWKPMHLQPVFAGARGEITGVAQRLFETGLTLPSGSVLDGQQIQRIFDAIGEFLEDHS